MDNHTHNCIVCGYDPCRCPDVTWEDWLNPASWDPRLDTHKEVHEHGRD